MYPSVLLITLLTIAGIALAGVSLIQQSFNDSEKQTITIGVVGDSENSYIQFGLSTIESLDNSRFYLKFTEMDEAEAKTLLEEGKIHGYVHIPPEYIKSIMRGENAPATFYTLNNPDNYSTILTNEATKIVSRILTETQLGVYSCQHIIRDNLPGVKPYLVTNDLNIKYVEQVLKRQAAFETKSLGIADSISMGGYYVCGIITFFLLLWGISCSKLLTAKNLPLSRSINNFGLTPSKQILCEYLPFLLITVLTFLLLAITAGFIADGNDWGISELADTDIASCMGFVFKSMPVLIMITLFHMCLYELVSGTVSSIMIQFLVSIGLGYLSGCFYPNYFFPMAVQKFAAMLPSGLGFSYMRKLLTETLTSQDLLPIALYILLFAVVTVIVRRHRIAGDKQ